MNTEEANTTEAGPEREDQRMRLSLYSPCICGSGRKLKFCCLATFKEEKLKRQQAKYLYPL